MKPSEESSASWIASRVKIADVLHNLGDSPSSKQVKRYAEGLRVLLAQ